MHNTRFNSIPTSMIKLNSVHRDCLPVPGFEPWYVCESDPAISIMTDFRSRSSVTVLESLSLNHALEHMKHVGVRCAFVVDEKKNAVVGMITAYDILGEKPQQYMRFTGVAHDDVLVKDIMQKISDWQTVDISEIELSSVKEVLELFNETGVTHLPVMETTENNEQRLRGLLSFSKVKRLLVNAV